MKKLLCLITALCMSHFSFASFEEGAVLQIVARSGLMLRTAPSTTAPVIAKMEYGEEVIVLNSTTETNSVPERVNWVEGNWILVDYMGLKGYVFDGYLSNLVVPLQEYELSDYLDDLPFLIENYVFGRLKPIQPQDTLHSSEASITIMNLFSRGQKIVTTMNEATYTVELTLDKVRIMDAFHLVAGMMMTNDAWENFMEQAVFRTDGTGSVSQISVGHGAIRLEKIGNNRIKITAVSAAYGC